MIEELMKIINTLDKVTVSGHDNLTRMVACMNHLDNLIKILQEQQKEVESDVQSGE